MLQLVLLAAYTCKCCSRLYVNWAFSTGQLHPRSGVQETASPTTLLHAPQHHFKALCTCMYMCRQLTGSVFRYQHYFCSVGGVGGAGCWGWVGVYNEFIQPAASLLPITRSEDISNGVPQLRPQLVICEFHRVPRCHLSTFLYCSPACGTACSTAGRYSMYCCCCCWWDAAIGKGKYCIVYCSCCC